MHRWSLVWLLFGYSCIAHAAKQTWWSNVMDDGETRTTTTWAKSKPVQVSLGTAMSKKKIKSAIHSSAQTPQKFWENKSFEALLHENQKDGLDQSVKPVRQIFKSWEYTKDGNKPAKLIEKSWEKSGDFIIPPTVKIIEHDDGREALFRLNEWTTQVPKQTPPVRWDDKPEFSSTPKNKKIIQKFDFDKQREKPKVKIVAKKLITLKKRLETEDIPIGGIINSNHESSRLIKKEGLIQEPKKPEIRAKVSHWFKMPSTTTERFTTPQVEYAIENVSPSTRRRSNKLQQKQIPNQNNAERESGTSDQNRPQKQQAAPKLSYHFEWGKRSDEEVPVLKSENLKNEEPVTDSVSRINDEDEEVTSIKELDDYAAKWEGLSRRTHKQNQEITTPLSVRLQKKPKTENIEKSHRQAIRIKETSDDFDRNRSAKDKPARQIFSFTSTVEHGPFKEEKSQKLKAEVNAKIQKKPSTTASPPKAQSTPARLQKRIDIREREREITDDIIQRKHNYEIEEVPEVKSAPQRGPAKEEDHGDDGKEWRLEDSIPGVPEQDYATFKTVPQTNFKCSDHKLPGYYGDIEAKCQAFHVCHHDGRQDSFVCPIGTVFNQQLFVCDWWNNFKCDSTPNYYELNANLYDYSKGGGVGGGDNKPRGIRETDDSDSDSDAVDEPEPNSALKSGSIYGEEETKGGGSHRNQVYFPEAGNNKQARLAMVKRRNDKAAIETRSYSSSSLSDEDEYWAASEQMPVTSYATRLSSLKVKQIKSK